MSIISIVAESVHTAPQFSKSPLHFCRYEIHAMSVDVAGKFHDAVDGDPEMVVT
jgi:hypothetical protein